MFNFAINYLEIFFIISYLLFIVYMTVIYPDYYSIDNKWKKTADSIALDYTSLVFILIVVSAINIFYTKYIHIIFMEIDLYILLSFGTALSGFISKFFVSLINIKNKSIGYTVYLVIFLILLIIYIIFVLKRIMINYYL